MRLFKLYDGSSGYFESLILTSLYLAAGYYLNPTDPCAIKSDIPVLTILLAIITLYHGLGPGVVSLLLVGVVMKTYYTDFEIDLFLSQFVLVLIFGEFHYYWHRVIGEQRYELKYLNRKFDEMVKAFYALKISHDQLEKMYVTKPMSLRNALETIRHEYAKKKHQSAYAKFLVLLHKSYAVESCVLAQLNGETLDPLAATENVHADYDDPLVQKALEKKMPVYIADNPHTESAYIAVIPVLEEGRAQWLLMIEKMPFLAYNKDTLVTVAILLQYFFYQMQKSRTLESIQLPSFLDETFAYELHRLTLLEKRFHVDSTLLVFKTQDPLLHHLLDQKVRGALRSLEIPVSYSLHGVHYLAILFPLVDDSAVEGFVARMREILARENLEKLDYATFKLKQRKLYRRYMGIDNE